MKIYESTIVSGGHVSRGHDPYVDQCIDVQLLVDVPIWMNILFSEIPLIVLTFLK